MYVKVKSPLKYGGNRLEPGAEVDLDEKLAKSLLADGVVEKTEQPESKEDRRAARQEADKKEAEAAAPKRTRRAATRTKTTRKSSAKSKK